MRFLIMFFIFICSCEDKMHDNVFLIYVRNQSCWSAGTGFFLNSGLAVTAGHVIDARRDDSSVYFVSDPYSKERLVTKKNEILYESNNPDIAIVESDRYAEDGFEICEFIGIGDSVVIKGYPNVKYKEMVGEVTDISADGMIVYTNAIVDYGASGSPILRVEDGCLVGELTRMFFSDNTGFGISNKSIRCVLETANRDRCVSIDNNVRALSVPL